REAFRLVAEQQVAKGDVLGVSEVAGTLAAKRTAELIPLCHPVGLDHVEVEATLEEGLPGVRVRAAAKAVGRTGVEMEALTAVSVALLTVYDMVKAADRGMVIEKVRSLEQSLEATRGELAVARLQLERANAIIDFSTHYSIAADLAAAIYDVSLAEGVDPALAFRLVRVESGFKGNAKSKVGAIGYTQVLPSTARLYEPGLTTAQLFERNTNLRLGFRYLRDLLERYEGNPDAKLRLALLAYNRGPGRVQKLLDA